VTLGEGPFAGPIEQRELNRFELVIRTYTAAWPSAATPPASFRVAARAAAAQLVPLQPGIDLSFGLILGVAVALLQAPGEFLSPSLNYIEVIVGKLAPLLLRLAFELFPVPFDPIPVHFDPP
jgi:hypothetical protein